ncbi:hypothetical protein WN943_001030 [Citrus x changshan-huyou]
MSNRRQCPETNHQDCLSRPFSEDVIPTGPHAETATLPKENLASQVDQVQSSKRKLKLPLSPKNAIKASQKEVNKRKSTSVKVKAYKSNDKLSKVEDDFHVFSELEDDISDGEFREQETQYHKDEHDANNDVLDGCHLKGLLEGLLQSAITLIKIKGKQKPRAYMSQIRKLQVTILQLTRAKFSPSLFQNCYSNGLSSNGCNTALFPKHRKTLAAGPSSGASFVGANVVRNLQNSSIAASGSMPVGSINNGASISAS